MAIFSWVRYSDRANPDTDNKAMIEDPPALNMDMPFDGKCMFWGGFELVVDE